MPAARSKDLRNPLKYVGRRDRPMPNRPQVGNLPHNSSVGFHPIWWAEGP